MPIKKCQDNNKLGYKWGDQGKCYTGTQGKQKALQQMKAIKASQAKKK